MPRSADAATKKRPARRRSSWTLDDLPEPLPPVHERARDWNERGLHLVGVYNRCLARASEKHGRPLLPKRPTDDNRAAFYALDLWCAKQRIDPSAWIYALFATSGWRPVRMGDLFSEKRLPALEKISDYEYGHADNIARAVTTATNTVEAFRPARDLYPTGAEVAKQNYLARGAADLCMANMDITLGYNERSSFCVQCPAKDTCAAKTRTMMGSL